MIAATPSTKHHTIHNLFISFERFRHIILVLSILAWVVCPLVGIVLLLLYTQINVSVHFLEDRRSRFQNFVTVTLALFTVTTYIASFTPFNDTVTYIGMYRQLAKEPIFSLPNIEVEPVSFIVPKLISIFTNGNELSFLFIQSITINSILFAYSIIFSPDFYPLIILINLMTAGYYFQLFWMRQFYSFIFIIPVCYISNISFALIFLFLSFYTHNSSLFYFFPLIVRSITEKTYFITKFFIDPLKKLFGIKFLTLTTLVTCLFLLPLIWNLAFGWLGDTDANISQKLNVYGGSNAADFNQDSANVRAQLRVIIDYATILLFAFGANFQEVKPIFYRWLFLFFALLLGYLGSILFGFNLRLNALFFCLPGFFYMIPLYSSKMVGKFNLYTGAFLFSIAFRLFYFFSSILLSYQSESYLNFWNGDPMFTPIISYFELFFEFLTSLLN